jgi:hypothetical protein
MKEQVLKEQRVLEKTLERFRERDRKACLPFIGSCLFKPLQVPAYFQPIRRVLILWLFGSTDSRQGIVDLLKGTFEMKNVSGITLEDMRLKFRLISRS